MRELDENEMNQVTGGLYKPIKPVPLGPGAFYSPRAPWHDPKQIQQMPPRPKHRLGGVGLDGVPW
jgi:bacteriocin-like protein